MFRNRPQPAGCGGGTQQPMQTIELDDEDVETLVTVLEQNTQAVDVENTIRWTPEAASRIADIKEEVAVQTD